MVANDHAGGLTSEQVVVMAESSGAPILIDDAHHLFSAEFEREGDSLVLSGDDGASIIVVDYFALGVPPDLASDAGAVLSSDLIAALVGPAAPGQYAQAGALPTAEPVGQVETLSGTARATRADGSVVELSEGAAVYQGDVLQTGPDTRLNVSFVDDTVFSLSGNARMVLNEVVYSPDASGNSMIMSLIQGAFTFITGQIAPTGDMQVNTPVVNIGIRGTTVHVTLGLEDGAVQISLSDGTVEFFNPLTGERVEPIGDTESLFTFRQPGLPPEETPKSPDVLEEERERAIEVRSVQAQAEQRTDLDDDDQFEDELQRAELFEPEEISDQTARSGSSSSTQQGEGEPGVGETQGTSDGQETATDATPAAASAGGEASETEQVPSSGPDVAERAVPGQTQTAQATASAEASTPQAGELPSSGPGGAVQDESAGVGNPESELAQSVESALLDEPAPLVTGAGPVTPGQVLPSGGIGTFDEPDFGAERIIGTDVASSSSNTTITTSPPPSASNQSVAIETFPASVSTSSSRSETSVPIITEPVPETSQPDSIPVKPAPVLGNNSLDVAEGGTAILNSDNLSATDAQTADTDLVFSVSAVQNGRFEFVAAPGLAITSFTQADVKAGAVQFVHDGGEDPPSYSVAISNGESEAPVAVADTGGYINVNDAPLMDLNGGGGGAGALADFTAGAQPVAIIPAAEIIDPDSGSLKRVTVTIADPRDTGFEVLQTDVTGTGISITGNGSSSLVLSGAASLAEYQQVLQRITYQNTAASPTAGERQIELRADDGAGANSLSEVAAAVVSVKPDTPPVLIENSLSLNKGETVFLTSANLSATDVETADADLVFAVSAVQNGQFERAAAPGQAVTSFTQLEVTQGAILFVHDGSTNPAAYSVAVGDGTNITVPVPAVVDFIAPNSPPLLINNNLTIEEGETVVLGTGSLSASDIESDDEDLVFTVSSVAGGRFELVASPGIAITSFSQAQVTGGLVQFVHDGEETAPSYGVSVSDGFNTTPADPAVVDFRKENDLPEVVENRLKLDEGETVVLDASNLRATDTESDDAGLIFTVSNIQHGQFELVAAPGVAVTSFSQAQIAAGAVKFVHDGGEVQPSYSVSVSDGEDSTAPAAAGITFLPVNDEPVVDLNGEDGASFIEGGVAQVVDADLVISDEDSANLAGATVVIENIVNPGDEVLSAVTTGTNILAIYDSATGQLDLSGDDSRSNYQQVLRSITYRNLSDDPTAGGNNQRNIRYSVSDGVATSVAAVASLLLVAVNDVPLAAADTGETDEDAVLSVPADGVLSNDSDPESGDVLTVSAVEGSAANVGNQVALSSGALVTVNADGSYDYDPNGAFDQLQPGESTTDNFTYRVSDGNGGSAPASVTITINGRQNTTVIDDAVENVIGAGATLFANDLIVAEFGTAVLSIADGGEVSADSTVIAANAGSDGTVDINQGGVLTTLVMEVGSGGTGTLLLDGVGSMLTVGAADAIDPGLYVGGFNGGTGEVTVSGGATLNAFNFDVGRGRTGSLSGVATIQDPGTVVNIDSRFGDFEGPSGLPENNGGFLRAARNDGDVGELHILNGAVVNIEAGFQETEPEFQLGRNQGSRGMAVIDAATLNILQTTPADPNPSEGSLGGPLLRVGRGGQGELTVQNGGQINMTGEKSALFVGRFATADGTFVVDGLGSRVQLSGDSAHFSIGTDGTGSATIRNGASVEVSETGSSVTIAEIAGSTGNLEISEGGMLTTRAIEVGRGGDGMLVVDGSGTFVTVGAESMLVDTGIRVGGSGGGFGSFTVSGGALLESMFVDIGRGATGTLSGVGIIRDPGTIVNLDNRFGNFGPPFENSGGALRVARDAGDIGELSILNGAVLNIGAGIREVEPGIQIAREAGSQGGVLIDSSNVNITQSAPSDPGNDDFGPFVQVGRGGTGRLTVQNSGTISMIGDDTSFEVGRDAGSEGTLLVDGAGSKVALSGNSAFFAVGGSGSGNMTIRNSASVELLDSGSYFEVAANAGSAGTLNIEQGGSLTTRTLEIGSGGNGTAVLNGSGSTLTVGAAGAVDPGLFVGGFDGGFGDFTVSGGATLNAYNFQIGRGATGSLSGVATIQDAGTVVNLDNRFGNFNAPFENDAGFLRVARNNGDVGELNILNGAVVNISGGLTEVEPGFQIARNEGSQGTVVIDSATVNMTQTTPSDPENSVFGPFLTIGRGGTGAMTVQNGGQINVSGDNSSMQVGRTSTGDGALSVDGLGSKISITGKDTFVSVGSEGTGNISLSNQAVLELSGEGVSMEVGREDASSGTLNILSGSQLFMDGGTEFSQLRIGDRAGGEGSVVVQGADSLVSIAGPSGFSTRIIVGGEGQGTLETRDGGRVAVSRVDVGSFDTGVGIALVDNATWDIGADGMNIGRENVGSLEIRNDATVNAERARIGWTGGSNGAVELDATSQLNVGLIQVGHGFYDPIGDPDFGIDASAFGTFNLTGGTVNANETRIGNHERGIGVVVMDGGTWNDATRLEVGTQGNGTLLLQNGAVFTSNGDFGVIANAGGATGAVTVDSTSQLQINGFFSIGNGFFDPISDPDFGQDDTATGSLVINGGNVSIEDGDIGGLARGDGNVFLNGGNFDVASHLSVAHEGTAALTITNGGTITSNSASIGNTVGSDGNVTVGILGGAGAPASWNVTNTLSIGHGDVAQAAVASGLVVVAKDSSLTATNINIEEGGTLNTADKGTVNGNINLFGGTHITGNSPGTAIINGDFTMSSGVLDIEAAGLGAGQFDLMEVSGEASILSGLIDFSFIEGYEAETGDAVVFMKADAGMTFDQEKTSIAVSGVVRDFMFELVDDDHSLALIAQSDAIAGDSTIFMGGSLNDDFFGGAGDDLLRGGSGADSLTGGAGADIFAYARGDGGNSLNLADLLTDFEDGIDKIGLEDGLLFSDLTISADASDRAVVSVVDTGELLVVLDGLSSDLVDEQDFVLLV
ncbi:cadherin-like domain-containing protein [Denitrobaculum tricleocarpae]|uniref:FecR protein domain-containing protein n=1 Tax=Denitrobaculum tricleocarpae TaxID=2591009 RepID=A0A545U1I8_9PROT|nr:cadherin-like domain-containing protein [Denitrobaculum tricleocarpae]TQV83304.1 hypothetical protein FKG95_01505 [Denitrobaculum tricleocarpae]